MPDGVWDGLFFSAVFGALIWLAGYFYGYRQASKWAAAQVRQVTLDMRQIEKDAESYPDD